MGQKSLNWKKIPEAIFLWKNTIDGFTDLTWDFGQNKVHNSKLKGHISSGQIMFRQMSSGELSTVKEDPKHYFFKFGQKKPVTPDILLTLSLWYGWGGWLCMCVCKFELNFRYSIVKEH